MVAGRKVTLIIVPIVIALLADRALVNRHIYYDRLLTEHECYPPPCQIDVNGDGIPGEIVDLHVLQGNWLIISDAGRELLRLPYDSTDGTLRTHIGVRSDDGGTRIIIYDGSRGPSQRVNAVYGWSGQGLSRVAPSDSDSLILSAMRAYDDTGSFHYWVLYKLMRLPLFIILLLGMVIAAFRLRARPSMRERS
jgi:hypothetical protein